MGFITIPIPRLSIPNRIHTPSSTTTLTDRTAKTISTRRSSKSNKSITKKSDDVLDVSKLIIKNGIFQPDINNKVSSYRPEIISTVDYQPIYLDNPINQELSLPGKYIELQHQASYLYRDLMTEFIAKASDKLFATYKNPVRELLETIIKRINSVVGESEFQIDFFHKINQSLSELVDLIDFKALSNSSISTERFYNLKEFFAQNLSYQENQYDSFTSTKIFYQFLSDLLAILENYSFNLVNIVDSDRANDSSLSEIDKTYSITSNFTFTIKNIQDSQEIKFATNSKVFGSFYSSLPTNKTDRIKILTTVLSKEFRVSRALGNSSIVNANSLNKFGIERQGNPFNNIIGIVGKSIFEDVSGRGSLAGIGKIIPESSNLKDAKFSVLPFEKKYIDLQGTNQTYIPGTDYFVNSIFDLAQEIDKVKGVSLPAFNTAPIKKFVSDTADRVTHAASILEDFLDLERSVDRFENLDSEDLFKQVIKAVGYGCLNPGGDPQLLADGGDVAAQYKVIDSHKEIINSVFKFASEDNKTKELLFQFLLLYALKPSESRKTKYWEKLRKEIGIIQNVSQVSVSKTATKFDLNDETFPYDIYIRNLARRIEKRIFWKFSQQNIVNKSGASVSGRIGNSFYTIYALKIDDIFNALLTPQTIESTNSNLRDSFISSVVEFVQLRAGGGNGLAHLIPDGTFRTRYNFLGLSTQFMLLYELFLSTSFYIIPTYFKVTSEQLTALTENNKNVGGQYIISEALLAGNASIQVQSVIPLFVTSTGQQTELQISKNALRDFYNKNPGIKAIKDNFVSIMTKLIKEEKIIKNAIYLLRSYVYRLEYVNSKISSTFNSTNVYSLWEKIGKDFPYEDFIKTASGPNQVKTLSYLLDSYKSDMKQSLNSANPKIQKYIGKNMPSLLSTNLIPTEIKEIMYLFFSSSGFLGNNSRNIKLFTVGIPSNFSSSLVERVSSANLQQLAKTKQNDIIKVCVHKNDIQYDDIVFKPQEFLFDLSLYQNMEDLINIKPNPGENFDKIMNRNFLTDYASITSKRKFSLVKTNNSSDIFSEKQYDFLTRSEKTSLMFNHFSSYMTYIYILLLTGMNLSEETFYIDAKQLPGEIDPTADVENDIETLFKRYVEMLIKKPINKNRSIKKLSEDETLPIEIRDKLKLFDMGNFSVSPKMIKEHLMSPRIFDRVFNIPVDINKFEIDIKKTLDTSSGKNAWNQKFIQDNILTKEIGGITKYYFKPKESDNTIFEEYFVTLEIVSELDS